MPSARPGESSPEQPGPAEFDRYAASYADLHQQSIQTSGESPEYFSRYKIGCLERAGATGPVLDYGCGIGNLTELLSQAYDDVTGYDPSEVSLEVARSRTKRATLTSDLTSLRDDHYGSAVLSGVLHHVPPPERRAVLATVRTKLRPGGRVFVFEHNPINPLTRKAVADCPFDEDAVLLWPWEVRRRIDEVGFSEVTSSYIVFFPRQLAFLRPLERRLAWCAIGAQTLTTGKRDR